MDESMLKQDIGIFFEGVDKKKLIFILKGSLYGAIRVTGASKGKVLKNLIVDTGKTVLFTVKFLGKESINFISDDDYMFNVSRRFKKYSYSRLKLVENIYSNFKKLKKLEKLKVAKDAGVLFFFMILAGGWGDLEGGIPDLDLKFGIGNHRNLFSHTILLPLVLETATRFIIGVGMEYKENINNLKYIGALFGKILQIVEDNQELMIGGMWAGVSLHLFKDAGLFHEYIKPYTGLSGLSMEAHKSIFLGNSFLALFFSEEIISKNIN
jgi:hypothetical protein